MYVNDPINRMPDGLLLGALATRGGACRSDLIRPILKKRGYSNNQIDKSVELYKKWWRLKPYHAVTFLRWSFVGLSIPIFNFNYEHSMLSADAYLVVIVLALLVCITLYDRGYRGTRRTVYQGFPFPMNVYAVLEDYPCPIIGILTGPLNILILTNLLVFFCTLATQ
jgi:hypothetical protein